MTTPMRRRAYLALALNASCAFTLGNYLLFRGWETQTAIVAFFTFGAYLLGHRYAHTGKEMPRRLYQILLVLYAALLALPEISRLRAANSAYMLGRLLMFRAVYLRDRREAYLHVLVYFVIVAACFGHWRADWTLLPFLLLYAASLLLVLAVLHQEQLRDGDTAATVRTFPGSNVVVAFTLALLLGVLLFIATPRLPGPHISLIPQQPRIGNGTETASFILDWADGLERGSNGGMRANPESGLGRIVRNGLKKGADLLRQVQGKLQELKVQVQKIVEQGMPMLVPMFMILTGWPWWAWLLLLLLLLLLWWLWRRRHHLWLVLQVRWLDPWRVRRLQRDLPATAPGELYAAFERLWAYHGLPRAAHITPIEHLRRIAAGYPVLGKPSASVVGCFQRWRYGQGELKGFAEALQGYGQLRTVLEELRHTPAAPAGRALPRGS